MSEVSQIRVKGTLYDIKDAVARLATGAPAVASTAAGMTDTSKIYVYTGTESGYTKGNWYYHDGTSWVSGGVYQSSGIETDSSLSVSGAAADAKVTGDAINNVVYVGTEATDSHTQVLVSPTSTELDIVTQADFDAEISDLKSAIDHANGITFVAGKYINNAGNEVVNSAFECTDFIELTGTLFNFYYSLHLDVNGNVVSYYDDKKVFKNGVAGAGNGVQKTGITQYPDGAKYVRFAHCIASGGVTNPEPVVILHEMINNRFGINSVGTDSLRSKAVTVEKSAFIVHDPDTDYIDKTKYANGYISANGIFVSNNGWRATEYIELQPETTYYSSNLYNGYCAFFDADKNKIAGYGTNAFTTTSFTTPANTAFARFSINASWQSPGNAWLYTKNERPSPFRYILNGVEVLDTGETSPCDFNGNEISVFNKILCIGDSMTEGTFNNNSGSGSQYPVIGKYSYPTFLQKLTGVEVTNKGHGGFTSAQWYAQESSSDLSGYDCAIIQLGINDVGSYGTWGTDSETAFTNIINKLKTENKNIKIFVANIIPATSYSSSAYKTFSSALLAWVQETYASDANVIPLDIQQYGHTAENTGYNCGHLSALGYRRLAEDYKSYISWYINHNKTVFREVQFIGTDYWYVNPNN